MRAYFFVEIFLFKQYIKNVHMKLCSMRGKINVTFHDTGLFRCNETVVNTRFSRPTMTLRINFY